MGLEALEVLRGEGFVEGWRGREGGADGAWLGLVGHFLFCLFEDLFVVSGKDYITIEWESIPKMRQGTLTVTCMSRT